MVARRAGARANEGTIVVSRYCYRFDLRHLDHEGATIQHRGQESESQWAESVANGDASVVERILADDFLGVDPDGNFYEKAKMVADTREAPKEFISNHLNDVKVRFFGDTAVAQGNESWVRRTGTPLHARFVWTDTWILRNGKWQIVASEDLIAPEPAQKPAN
jgi:ketosteroid isomerase-like protein